jgi:hypothetical protein
MTRLLKFLSLWLGLWLLVSGPLRALEIGQTIWGYDGHVVADCFNPVSMLVSNSAGNAFDGTLVLSSSDGAGTRGTEFVQSIFLAPRTSRWVQFYVYTGDGAGSYEVRWGRGAHESYEMEGPVKGGPPARVWLRDTENPFAQPGSLKSFPDQLFPTVASAAEGLDAVVLDHVPRWEPARREAFLDWLKLGGTVHVLPDATGHSPIFGEGLELLDTRDDVSNVGLGRVVHHAITPREMSEQYLLEHGYSPRTMATAKSPAIYNLDSVVFRNLSAITKPHVSWWLVNLLVVAYVVVIGPVHNYYRRRLDYRVSILVFLGCVAVFGLALGITGRRGYHESQTINSLTIAHALGGGRVDVTQWISAFATTGDRYTLTHRAPSNLYSTGGGGESGGGIIFNGRDGHIQLDIPLYSARAFLHRAITTGDDTSVTVEKWDEAAGSRGTAAPAHIVGMKVAGQTGTAKKPAAGDTNAGASVLNTLRLKTGPGFPPHAAEIYAVYGDHIYNLVQRNGGLELNGAPETLATRFSREKLNPWMYTNFAMSNSNETDTPLRMMPLILARATKAPDIFANTLSTPDHHADLQLLVVAPMPASFQLQGPGFTRESGWVLYVQDVFKP